MKFNLAQFSGPVGEGPGAVANELALAPGKMDDSPVQEAEPGTGYGASACDERARLPQQFTFRARHERRVTLAVKYEPAVTALI